MDKGADWHRLKDLVLDSVSSPITKRVYNLGLDEFFARYGQETRPGFTKATWPLGALPWKLAVAGYGTCRPRDRERLSSLPALGYCPTSTSINVLGTGLGRAVGFCGVAGTGSFCSVPIEKMCCVFGSSEIVRAP